MLVLGLLFLYVRRKRTRKAHHRGAPSVDYKFNNTPFVDTPSRPVSSHAAQMRNSGVPIQSSGSIIGPRHSTLLDSSENPFEDPGQPMRDSLLEVDWDNRTTSSRVTSRAISFAVSETDSLESISTLRVATTTAFTSATPAMVTFGNDDPFADPVPAGPKDFLPSWRGPNLSNLITAARGSNDRTRSDLIQ